MLVRFHDVFTIKPINVDKVDDSIGLTQTANGLRAVINASHAGIITRNNGLYLPSEMKKAADGLNKGYKKPFLVHHDKHSNPIGRIVNARYVDTSTQALQVIQNSSVLKTFNDSHEVKKQLPAVEVLRKTGVLNSPDWEGLGYLQIEVVIPDKEAAQMFMDGRYQTVSVGLTAGTAICSLPDCHTDWADDTGKCDHMPGKSYGGERAFLIIGNFRYDEVSAVNTPADPFASVVQILNSADESESSRVDLSEVPLNNSVQEPMVYSVMDFTKTLDAIEIESTTDKNFVIKEHDSLHYMYDYLYQPDRAVGGPRGDMQVSQAALALHAKFHKEANLTAFRDDFIDGPLDVTLVDFGVVEEQVEEAAPAAAIGTLVEQNKPTYNKGWREGSLFASKEEEDAAELASWTWRASKGQKVYKYITGDDIVPCDEYARSIKNEDHFNEALDFLEEDRDGLYAKDANLLIKTKHHILKRGTIYNWTRRTKPNMNELELKVAELEGKLAGKDALLAETEVKVKDLEDKVYVLRDELRIAHCDNKALEEREKELQDKTVKALTQVVELVDLVSGADHTKELVEVTYTDLCSMSDSCLSTLDREALKGKLFPTVVAGIANPEPEGTVAVEEAATKEQEIVTPVISEDIKRIAANFKRIRTNDGQYAGLAYLDSLVKFNLLSPADIDNLKAMLE